MIYDRRVFVNLGGKLVTTHFVVSFMKKRHDMESDVFSFPLATFCMNLCVHLFSAGKSLC